jgi:hypothetical protein
MTDYPMIFSAPMVQALLAGRKTQTRRLLKPQPSAPHFAHFRDGSTEYTIGSCGKGKRVPYAPGDRLYVREAMHWTDNLRFVADDTPVDFDRMPDGFTAGRAHVSGMFMPRWASRITLTVTEVRAQRVQDISEEDAMAEGVESGQTSRGRMWKAYGEEPNCWVDTPRMSFIRLWNSIHGPDAWDRNDWVAAYTFTVQRGNIDQVKS